MNKLPDKRRGKLKARMLAWAQTNSWVIVNENIMHRLRDADPPIYELKCNQERVLFIRCRNDAIAFGGFTKKDHWSKKDQGALDALIKLGDAAASECGSNP